MNNFKIIYVDTDQPDGGIVREQICSGDSCHVAFTLRGDWIEFCVEGEPSGMIKVDKVSAIVPFYE